MNDSDTQSAVLKVCLSWALTIFGGITLQGVATSLAILFTAVQLYVLVRNEILNKREKGKP